MNSKDKKKEVLVVVHDAGGAEVIGAYIKRNSKHERFAVYGAGPARQVFRRLLVPLKSVEASARELAMLMQRHAGARYTLVAAPGWMTKMEINALEAAKRAGLRTVVYMDSWVDERTRFGYPRKGWQKRLPDEFWAGDRYEFTKLKKQFPRIPVRFVPNQYFKDEVRRFRGMKRKDSLTNEILFMSDVYKNRDRSRILFSELLRTLAGCGYDLRIRIRFHPADRRGKYNELIRRFKSRIRVKKSSGKDILQDIARARVVVGVETVALAIAVLCGVPTISLVGQKARPTLPFPDIMRTRSAREAVRLVLDTASRSRLQGRARSD